MTSALHIPAPAEALELNAVVLTLQEEVAQLRGLPFKAAVPALMQSPTSEGGNEKDIDALLKAVTKTGKARS